MVDVNLEPASTSSRSSPDASDDIGEIVRAFLGMGTAAPAVGVGIVGVVVFTVLVPGRTSEEAEFGLFGNKTFARRIGVETGCEWRRGE